LIIVVSNLSPEDRFFDVGNTSKVAALGGSLSSLLDIIHFAAKDCLGAGLG